MRAGLLIALTAVWASAAQPGPPQLLPVDEAAKRPDFFAFRAQLQTAIARHDVEAVMAVVHPDIRNTFGPGDEGVEGFRRLWRVREADSELWAELGGALALGGSFHDENMFVAPYTSSRWPGQYSGFEYVPLIAANVRVRDAPRADAGVLSTLSFAILARARLDKEPPPAWTAVRVEGKTGYVESQYVRSPTDYRAFFAHRDGRWQLVTFIAGD